MNELSWDVRTSGARLTSGTNVKLTQGLFIEFQNSEDTAPYTFKDFDISKDNDRVYISFSAVYLDSSDEYEAAMRLVGSWKHWQKLLQLKWFVEGLPQFNWEGIESLRATVNARDHSLARRKLLEAAEQGNVTAAKAVLEGKEIKKNGRPQKGEQTEEFNTNIVGLFDKAKGI
jgi:hypothetical protein